MNGKLFCAIGSGLLLSLAGIAQASDADQIKALQAQNASIQAQLDELKGNAWLSERQSEEVKALVNDAIADAQTHPSLMGTGMTAGRDETAFFIASETGEFRLNFFGQIDLRYMTNFRQGQGPSNTDESSINRGFELTRAKLQFFGHIADPRLMYNIRLAVDPATNSVSADTITIGYKLLDGKLTVWGGEDKAPFLRESLTQSYRQLAVERSLINYLFTPGGVQGLGFVLTPGTDLLNDMLKVQFMVDDGFRSGENGSTTPTQAVTGEGDEFFTNGKAFNEGRADIAFTGRVDLKLAGAWVDEDDFAAWPDRPFSAFIGAAFHYEVGKTGDFGPNNNFFEWTVDGSAKYKGFGVFASVVGLHTQYETQITPPNGTTGDDSLYGAVVQGSYNWNSKLEPFIRYEVFLSPSLRGKGVITRDAINLVTAGFNWYNKKHDAKTTVDFVYAINELPSNLMSFMDATGRNTGLLPDASGKKNQMVLRVQYQLLF